MNQYSELLYFLKGLAEDNQLVNTVTKGSVDKIDLEKANIYPLFHIDINDAGFTNGSTITFEVTLTCLSQRDINKEIVEGDKFWSNDNEVDNHNETLSILNDVWLRILRDWEDKDITTEDNATLQKIEFSKGNILDGWSLAFTVELPNTTISLCDGPYYPELGYGLLYNFPAVVDARLITSSDDWSIPSVLQVQNLADYLGASGDYFFNNGGGKLKEIGFTRWSSPNTGATDEYGLSLIGSGRRFNDGTYQKLMEAGHYWTATETESENVNIYVVYHNTDSIQCDTSFISYKNQGRAIRLVKDATGSPDGAKGTYTGNNGNVYNTIAINGLWWVIGNLKETENRDGSEIPTVTDNTEWSNLTTGAKCAYNNDEGNV